MDVLEGENGEVTTAADATNVDDTDSGAIAVAGAPDALTGMPATLPAGAPDAVSPDAPPDTLEDDPERTMDYVAVFSWDTDPSAGDSTNLSTVRCDDSGSGWPTPSPRMDPARSRHGDDLPGYELISILGRGGMGIVYKARHLGLDRLVALKMLQDSSQANPEYLERFQIEAQVVARLHHPNILQIYEIGTALGRPYVAFELLEAGTLARRLAGTPQPDRESAALLITLARAVHAAHQAGVVHRDLKPSNVLYDPHGVPKIADFGLAKRLEVDDGRTRTGQVMGTPSYMAPEQAEGRVRAIGPATDIYGLGSILYELLTGRPPFKGETSAETLKLVLTEEIIPPSRLRPRIPRDLETVCLKCLDREPQKRYADAAALADDLVRYLDGVPVVARRTPVWERVWKWARRHPAATTLLALSGAAVVTTAVLSQQAARRTHAAVQREATRVAGLRREVDDTLFDAQTDLTQRRWDDARVLVTRALSRIEREPRLTDLSSRAGGLLDRAQQGLGAQRAREQLQARYRRFQDARDETLFLDTQFAGLDTTVPPEATRRAAEAALAVFMTVAPDGGRRLVTPPAGLSPQEEADVRGGCYELLMVLAAATARSAGADPDPARRADEALRTLEQAAELHPAPTRAYHRQRAEYLALKGETEEAARERERANALAPADAYDFFLSGRARARRGDWAAAITDLDAVLQQQPDHFWAQCLLAVAYMQLHEPLKARPSLNACLQRRRDAAWLYLLRGLANAQVGELALDAATRFPERARNLNAEAAAQFDAAEADYRAALERLADRPGTAELRYALLVNRGQFRLQRGDLADAEADVLAAARLDGRRYEAPSALGRVFQKQGRIDEALEQCGRAIALRPDQAPLYRERADVLIGLKNLTGAQRAAALDDLERAIRLESPANTAAIAADRTNQARLLHQEGRDEDALAAAEAALALSPRHAGAHRLRIQALLGLKRYDELIDSCDVAVQSGKPSADLYELRGMAHDALGRHSSAISDYTMALSVPPRTSRVLARRGWAYLIEGAAAPALEDFDAAVALDRQNTDAYNGRGLARAQLGRHRDAVLDAERALRQGNEAEWRTFYNAARIYAQAALTAGADARKLGPDVVTVVAGYQDRAVLLIKRALESRSPEQRAAFLRDTVRKDPVFRSLQRRLRALE